MSADWQREDCRAPARLKWIMFIAWTLEGCVFALNLTDEQLLKRNQLVLMMSYRIVKNRLRI